MRRALWLPLVCLSLCNAAAPPSLPSANVPVTVHTKATGDYPLANYTAVISPDGSRAAFITDSISIRDAKTGKEICVVGGKDQPVWHAAFAPDASRFAWVGPAGGGKAGMSLWVYDIPSGKLLYSSHENSSLEFVFARSTTLIRLALPSRLGDTTGGIGLVDIDTGKTVWSLEGKRIDFVWSEVSPDGMICSANELAITEFNLQNGSVIRQIPLVGGQRPVLLSLAAEAKDIRAAFQDGTATTWEFATGKQLSRVEPQELIRGQPLCFSPDGRSLLVSTLGAIRFFDLQAGKEIARFRTDPPVSACTPIARNGRFVAAVNGNQFGDAQLVTLPPAASLDLMAPANPARNLPPAVPIPAPTPPATVDEANPASLARPQWWCRAARAEAERISDAQTRSAEYSELSLAYAGIGDVQHSMECMNNASTIAANANVNPVLQQQAAGLLIKLLARSGRSAEATKLFEIGNGNAIAHDRLVGEFAMGRALAGDIDSAIQFADSIGPPMQARLYPAMVRALADAGAIESAQKVLDRSNPADRLPEMQREIALAMARAGDVKAALSTAANFAGSSNHHLGDRSIYGELAAAASAGNDNAALAIVAQTPEKDRQNALAQVGLAQVERGDLPAARNTLTTLGQASAAYALRRTLALAYARKGDYQTAEMLDGNEISFELFNMRFRDLINSAQFDAAATRLDELSDDPKPLKFELRLSLTAALVMHNQFAKAIDLYQNARQDPYYDQARALIDEGYLRAGKTAEYLADRKPLLEKLSSATGAPSRLQAQQELWEFDLFTGNFKAVGGEWSAAGIDEKGLVLGLGRFLDKRLEQGDFAYARGFAAAIPPGQPRAVAFFIAQVSAAHIQSGRTSELAEWIKTLPMAHQRCEAYLASANALAPKSEEHSEF